MPLKVDIQEALDNEALHDVRLIGTDNVEIPCAKFVLAIRSPVFQRMFFGDYRERDSDSVKLDYHYIVLNTLIKYCYSDLLDFKLILNAESSMTDEEVTLLFDLRDAANYFEIAGVGDHVFSEIGKSIIHKSGMGCVCAALTSLSQRVETGSPFWDILCQLAANNPEACFLPKDPHKSNEGIKAVPSSILKEILENLDDAYVVTCCLKEWREENLKNENPSAKENHKLLNDLANGLDLKSIPTEKLANVKPCTLFSKKRLDEALSNQDQNDCKQKASIHRDAIFVSGAGMEDVNGYYTKPNEFTCYEICFKMGETLEEKDSRFTIKLIQGRWTICAKQNGLFGQGKHLYQAPIGARLSFLPNPSSSWTCVEGTAPAPYVIDMELTDGTVFRPTPFVENNESFMLMAATAMEEHEDKSLEELRLEHYNCER